MKLYELITPSDSITFYASDNDIAEAAAIMVGNGQAGLKSADGSETPNTILFLSGFSEEQKSRFSKTMNERITEVLLTCKTFAVCSPEYRDEYDTLTKNSTDKKAVDEWDDKHRSSCSDWCGYARGMKLKNTVNNEVKK